MEKPKLKVEKNILDKFWLLAESNNIGIVQATESLLDVLLSKQKTTENDEQCSDVQYCVNRLVKGLASSRQSARQGFSVALCQILRKIKIVSVDDVLRAVAEHLKFTQKESKSEQGNILLGKALAYLTIIQSGRLREASGHHVKKVTNRLLEIRKKKSYLQQICTYAIALITSQVDHEMFTTSVWPEIETEMTQGWTLCTPETLLVLLACCRNQKSTMSKKFLKTHWNCSKIVSEVNFEHIWTVLMQTASCYPVIHLLNDELVQEIIRSKISVSQFWSQGEGVMFNKNQMRTMNIGLYLLQKFIPHVSSSEEMKELLSPTVITTLIKVVDGKKKDSNPLYQVAKQTITQLVDHSRKATDGQLQVAILKCLKDTECHHGPEITKAIDSIVQNITEEGAKFYTEYLQNNFHKLLSKSDEDNEVKLQQIVSELRTLVTLPSIASNHEFQLHVLQFLALHSFWTVNTKSATIAHCNKVIHTMDKSLRKQFQDNFFKALHNLLIFKTERSKSSSIEAFIHTIHQLIEYMQVLTSNTDNVTMVTHFTKEAMSEWKKVVKTMKDLQEKDSTDNPEVVGAFKLLFLHSGLQLFAETKNTISLLQDLHACYDKALQNKKKSTLKKCDKEPEWIEVITELLLSMMSQGSSLARAMAKNVFSHLAAHITPDSLSLITEILQPEKEDEDAAITFEDGEDEEEMEEDEIQDNDENGVDEDNDEDEDESNDDSESTDENDSDEEEVTDSTDLRQKVKMALGSAADDSDNKDDESDSDLSDSEMFKFDEALAAAFRGMKAGREKIKRENKQQLVAFKLRVLDLVEILVKNQPSADLVLDLIFPLLGMMINGTVLIEERELGNRSGHIFRLMYKKAKIHGNVAVSTDQYIEAVKSAIQFSTKASTRELIIDASDACLLVIRLLFHLDIGSPGPSPMKTRSQKAVKEKVTKSEKEEERIHREVLDVIRSSLTDFLQKKDHKLNQAFFHNMFAKFPVVFWPLTDVLLASVVDTECKVYNKSQACLMVATMINKDTEEHVGEEAWNAFNSSLKGVFNKTILEVDRDEYKSKLINALYQVFHKTVHVSKNTQTLSGDILDKMEDIKDCYNKDTRKLYNGIVGKLRERTVSVDTQMKNGKKRKKDSKDNVKTKKKK